MYYDEDDENMPHGICNDCGKECRAVMMDFGYGGYEYWGARGTHHDYRPASPCCEAEVVDGGSAVVRRSTHTARKQHGRIKPGERYTVTVRKCWRTGGPSWFVTEKKGEIRYGNG